MICKKCNNDAFVTPDKSSERVAAPPLMKCVSCENREPVSSRPLRHFYPMELDPDLELEILRVKSITDGAYRKYPDRPAVSLVSSAKDKLKEPQQGAFRFMR